MTNYNRGFFLAAVSMVVNTALFMIFLAVPGNGQETATDLPMWFDVATEQPVNSRLNTDVTSQLQNEEQLAVDPTNPNNLVAVWRDFRLGFRQCGWAYSHNGGNTWTEGGLIPSTSYNRDSDPGIVCGNNGWFYSVILSYDQFSAANCLCVPISLDSGETFPVYLGAIDHSPDEINAPFEDKELIAIDNTGGPNDGNLYIAWTSFGAVSQIKCISSTDGTGFLPPVNVSDDVNALQWPVPVVGTNGELMVAWSGSGAIKYDMSYDQGATFSTDRNMQSTAFISTIINGGITTFAFPALASDITGGPHDGNFYCAFADQAADGNLDLYFTKSVDAGTTWTPRVRINDDPLGNHVDQFHPWTYVNDDGVITVAFYDRRLDPVNNLLFDLWITHSFDGGDTWTPNQRVSDVSSSPLNAAASSHFISPKGPQPIDLNRPIAARSPQAGLIGEYIGLATSRLRASMVFTDTRNGNQDVYTANMPLRLFPPKLESPVDDADSVDPAVVFEWDDYSIYDSGLEYTLEYSTDPTFATGVVRRIGLTGHSYSDDTLSSGQYHWRMFATDPLGDSSAFSVSRSLTVPDFCTCLCFGDPECDSLADVFDVIDAVDVAFRSGPDVDDPSPTCPYTDTDVTCDDITDVFDVVAMVDVSFRGVDKEDAFCNPCGP